MPDIERSITHWTAGAGRAGAKDKKHYHAITEHDGTIVQGTEKVEDNIVTSDGDYAAHTRNLNSGSGGFAMAGMHNATEIPFDPGPYPINRKQFETHCKMLAAFHVEYGILPITGENCLTHAEVEPTLGVKQAGKWDLTRLPFEPAIFGAIPVGNYMRERVRSYLPASYQNMDRPILRRGMRGPFVVEAQSLLNRVGIFVGKTDGIFGQRTEAGILELQARSGLGTTGVVSPDTWRVLMKGVDVAVRDVTEEDLRAAGSNTIKIADEGERNTKAAAGAVVGLGALDTVVEGVDKLKTAEDALGAAQAIFMDNWPILILIGVGLFVWKYGPNLMKQLRVTRTMDAKMGANLKR